MSAATPWRSPAVSANGGAAYIPVSARRNLGHSNAAAASSPSATPRSENTQPKPNPASSQSTKPKVEWPPAVRQYVQRSFTPEYQVADVSKQELEQKLKEIITKAAENNSLHDEDWDNKPLPQEIIMKERRNAFTASSTAAQDQRSSYAAVVSNGAVSSPTKDMSRAGQSQKRKSSEFSTQQDEARTAAPPWRRTNNRSEFEKRNATTDKRRRIDNMTDTSSSNKVVSKFNKHHLENRRRRFEDSNSGYGSPSTGDTEDTTKTAPDAGPVIGTCQKLEKNYFRLTAPPKPENVRPLEVLTKTLDLLKKKWRHEGNYGYICDQFKSMRQDLTVQHIKNEFTVSVYEIHARIALEKGDLGEYNQCQTQLRALYAMQLGGHPTEFKAYRILYFVYTRNQTAINDTLADLTPAEKLNEAVKHALNVRSALALGNYHRFFRLYLDTPNMGAYLMDMFVDRERLSALSCICKAYKFDVKLRFITEELGFESDSETVHFILKYAPEELLQQQGDGVKLLTGKAGLVFEQAKAAAHRVIDIKGQI